MMTTEITKLPDVPVKELTYDELPPLLPQQAKMLNYIIDGDNYTDAYRKAGYTSDEYAGRAAYILVTRNPLKAHLEYFMKEMAKLCTPEYLMNKLNAIASNTTNKSDTQFYDPDVAIKAIQEINKMQGNYVTQPTTQINNVNGSISDVRNALNEYKKEC